MSREHITQTDRLLRRRAAGLGPCGRLPEHRTSRRWGCWMLLAMLVMAGLSGLLHAQSQPASRQPATQPATDKAAMPGPRAESKADSNLETARAQARGSSSEDPEPRREPSATEILKELMKQSAAAPRPVIRPKPPGQVKRDAVTSGTAPNEGLRPVARKLLPDGFRLVDRPGRLAREGGYYVYSFESRGRGLPEPPIRLLPNRLLEDMEIISAGGTKSVVFIISGEVTEYHGVNYLLVQQLLVRPDLGNLK